MNDTLHGATVQQENLSTSNLLLVGIGNTYRSDDALGLHIARLVKKLQPARVTVKEESGEGAALMELWKNAPAVILVDAVSSGSPPGTVHRFEAHRQSIPIGFFHYSTHAFSVAEAIELARTLDELPANVIVYGIEGKGFGAGQGLSIEVEKSIEGVVAAVLHDVENWRLQSKGG